MTNTNKVVGNRFEDALCKMIHQKTGAWVHNMQQSKAGQPADILVLHKGKAHLIDAKVCKNGRFVLSRVEENQRLSMDAFNKSKGSCWFAIRFSELESIEMTEFVPWSYIKWLIQSGVKSITRDDLNGVHNIDYMVQKVWK